MSVRAYMLLDIADRSCEYAVQMLRSKAEVILADRLEGYPNLITMVEAANRQSLAEAIIPVLDCVDGIAEDLRLLVTQDGEISPALLASNGSTSRKRRVRS
jgi:hypothetical protein